MILPELDRIFKIIIKYFKQKISRKFLYPTLTLQELKNIFNIVIKSLKVYFKLPDISFEDLRYIKFALKRNTSVCIVLPIPYNR